MKIKRYSIIIVIVGVVLVKLCFNCMAISASVSLSELVAESDCVILGFAEKSIPMMEHKTDNSGKIISLVLKGPAYSISVKEVLYARDPSLKKEKEIYYLQKNLSIESAIILPNKAYLLFLKKDSIDPELIKKYSLPIEGYFSVVYGRQGQRDGSDLTYIEATRKFCSIKELNDENRRIEEWKKLLKSDNLELKKAAKLELEKAGYKIEE